ncbi:hypothetical protein [Streptomyces sp. L7]|uniref:hypothetical protein n=1 Tax=Streptomyces sp. L7 TaxID=3423954 RepID=UPI003D95AA69
MLNPVRITLRIDDQRHLPVMHEIRAVSKLRSVNHNYVHKFLLLNMHERPGQALVFTGNVTPGGIAFTVNNDLYVKAGYGVFLE